MLHLIYTDDNPDDGYIVKKCIQNIALPIRFNWLSDGKGLLNYLQKREEYLDRKSTKAQHVILLDINMPELSGFEVLSAIKEDVNQEILKIPIIMFSSSHREEDTHRLHASHRCKLGRCEGRCCHTRGRLQGIREEPAGRVLQQPQSYRAYRPKLALQRVLRVEHAGYYRR